MARTSLHPAPSAPPSYFTGWARGTGHGAPTSAAAAWLLAAVGCLACAGEPAPAPADETRQSPPPAPPPSAAEAWQTDLAELRSATLGSGARAAQLAATAEGVEAGRRAAELARVLSIRDPDADWIARARAWLQEASRRRSLPGSCDAALELARLESRDAADPAAAYRVAFRTALRFEARDAACVAAAERMMSILAPWRPGAAELAALRADPHGEDPSVGLDEASPARAGEAGLEPPEPGGEATAAAAAWAAERAEQGAEATLQALVVYGHAGPEGQQAASARVVLRFDRVVSFEHGEAAASAELPRRTWLELPSVRPGSGVASATPVEAGGLRRIRTRTREGGTRVTLDLQPDARFRAFVLPEPFRIVLDVEQGRSERAGPLRVIVLDPGHGGDDFGARAFGMRESDLTLDIARRVRVLLARRLPEVRVVLTREEDVFVSLEQRAAMANALDADLFLSLHLNAADEPIDRGGVTTFVLDTSNDRQALRLAARENGTTVSEVDSLSRLIASLHREEQVSASRSFAEQLHRSTLAAARQQLPGLHDRGVRSAMFYVLVGARMPAVLLEASFLSQPEEGQALRTTRYRQGLAEGVAEGIVSWASE